MIKKLVSRALLSMMIDKKARETLEKRRTAKAGPGTAPAGGGGNRPTEAAPQPGGDPLDDLPETLIRQAIDEASREVDRRTTAARGGPGSERARLIQEALDVQKRQSKLLDELPREQREKLVVMAHQALIGDVEKARAAKSKKKPPKVKG